MNEDLEKIAHSLVWWKPPGDVAPEYLIRRAMEMGTPDMVRRIRTHFGEPAMRAALCGAEPGNFSARSWNYWHVYFNLRPTPPLPRRVVPDSPYVSAEICRVAPQPARPLAVAR